MKETLRTKLFEHSVQHISNKYPDIPEHRARNISSDVSIKSIEILTENNRTLGELSRDLILEAEKNKKMFRAHIENLQKETKQVLQKLKDNGCISFGYDTKLRRNVITARSSVLKDTVDFLNKLNTFVIDFYKDVYKIDEQNNDDRTQITLF